MSDLRKALTDVLSDIAEYERINNLAPNPGKSDCWASVTRARAALAEPEWRPSVEYNADLNLTTAVVQDAFTVWRQWTAGGILQGHAVDVGYDEAGNVVGIQIWDDVRLPSPPEDKT